MASISPAPAKVKVKITDNQDPSTFVAKYHWERSHHASVFSLPNPEVSVADWSGNKAKTHLHSQVSNLYSKYFTSPGPGGETSTCSTWDKSTVIKTNCEWQQIPPQAVFLGHRRLLPCRWQERGRPIHTEQSADKRFSCWEILIWKGNVGRRKRKGRGCEKSSCCEICILYGLGMFRGTQWPSSTIGAPTKIFYTKMLPDQVYWNSTLIKALVDNELKHQNAHTYIRLEERLLVNSCLY